MRGAAFLVCLYPLTDIYIDDIGDVLHEKLIWAAVIEASTENKVVWHCSNKCA